MNQVLQHLGTGVLARHQVPCPQPRAGQLLIESRSSLISPGTERMLVEFGRGNWLAKARQHPDRVRQVIEKVCADGAAATLEAVRAKLDREMALGYANAGVVVRGGHQTGGFRVGDRVVSNGPHAEMAAVSRNLCARIPETVSDEEAPFAVLAAIALEGLRLAAPTLGERFVVTGLGLVGLLAAQLLRQAGCRVLGLDFNPARLELARRWGVETFRLEPGDPAAVEGRAREFSLGRGVDGVLIAAATDSPEPVRQAAAFCRQRGRIVLTGVAGLELSRDLFYKKELSFQVSCSYGPGRYDPAYEQQAQDYPFAHVRWTAQRNFEAALDLMADGRLEVAPLISHRFAFAQAPAAYDLLASGVPSLGVLLNYEQGAQTRQDKLSTSVVLARSPAGPGTNQEQQQKKTGTAVVGVLGAGEFAGKVLLPELARSGVTLRTIVSASGVSAAWAARRFGFAQACSDEGAVLEDPALDTVVIATRHDSHARLVAAALRAGKSVWVEKPLARHEAELDLVIEAWLSSPRPRLMVGFNRRFAPLAVELKQSLRPGRKEFRYLINAGALDASHWTLQPEEGGGRILGEACHFIDLLRYLCGSAIVDLEAKSSGSGAHLWLEFADGSTGVVDYLTSGARSYPKERLEVFTGGRVLALDNFRRLRRFPAPMRDWLSLGGRQDKGHRAAMSAFVASVREGQAAPICFDELVEVSRWSIRAAEQLA